MSKWNREAEKIMMERFGRDTIISLSTVKDDMPYVRYVNAYYENDAFYIITYALSNKMKHIENNSTVAIADKLKKFLQDGLITDIITLMI